jgi:hypothetical protein
MTCDDIREFTRQVDTLVIGATSKADLHRKLNVLRANGSKDWLLLRTPTWVQGVLVAVVVKPQS